MQTSILSPRPSTSKRAAGKATLERIDELGRVIADAQAVKRGAERTIAEANALLLELAEKYRMPGEKDGAEKSEFAFVASGELRVTRPSPPTPEVDPTRLLALLVEHNRGDEAAAGRTFLDVAVVKKIDIDLQRWNEAVEREAALDSMLLDSLKPERAAPKPIVKFTPKGGS